MRDITCILYTERTHDPEYDGDFPELHELRACFLDVTGTKKTGAEDSPVYILRYTRGL